MARFGGGTRFAETRFAEYDFGVQPAVTAAYKNIGLGDFIVREGNLSVSDTIDPQVVREFRRMGVRIKNQGTGLRNISITVGKTVDDIIAGYNYINAAFSVFSDDGESGTLRIQTDNENRVEQEDCWLVGVRLVTIEDTYIELEYTWKRSLF